MRYAKLRNVDIVGKFFIPIFPIDTKPQVMSAQEQKADFIYTGVVISQGGAVARDLYELGAKGDPTKEEGKIEIIGMFPMSGIPDMIKIAGAEEAVNGMILVGDLANIWENQPELLKIREYAQKHGRKDLDHNYVHEWYSAMTICKAIEMALQKVPADELKGSHVWEAMLNIKNFDTGGIVPNKVTYSEEQRLGIGEKVRIDRIEGKNVVRVGYVENRMLAPIYTEEYARAHGHKSIYSSESLKWLNLSPEEVGYKRIKE